MNHEDEDRDSELVDAALRALNHKCRVGFSAAELADIHYLAAAKHYTELDTDGVWGDIIEWNLSRDAADYYLTRVDEEGARRYAGVMGVFQYRNYRFNKWMCIFIALVYTNNTAMVAFNLIYGL